MKKSGKIRLGEIAAKSIHKKITLTPITIPNPHLDSSIIREASDIIGIPIALRLIKHLN